jgi:transcriptional regulator with XRE-family HTH domain
MEGARIVAWNIRKLRVAKGLSQEALAVDAGLDRSYIGRLERAVENPTIETLGKLADALGVRLVDLVEEPGPEEVAPRTLTKGRKARSVAKSVSG